MLSFIFFAMFSLFSLQNTKEIHCNYGNNLYKCGEKLPNGHYCNFLGCGNDCCQLMFCSNYVNCFCNVNGQYELKKCENSILIAKFNGTKIVENNNLNKPEYFYKDV
jgi:hypothetical protein